MKTLKIGIATPEEYRDRTLAIARGDLKPSPQDPKIWFTSLESAARLLSQSNRELLALIARVKPDSLAELAQRTGRATSNLSRTLKTMERYGLVSLRKGRRGAVAPRVSYNDIRLDVRLPSSGDAVAAWRLHARKKVESDGRNINCCEWQTSDN